MSKKKKVISRKWRLKKEDLLKSGRNALVFAAPALIVLLASFKGIVPQDANWAVLALYALNILTDLLKKLANENKY